MKLTNKIIFTLAKAASLLVFVTGLGSAHAYELEDTRAFQTLRAEYIEAVESNKPESVGELVTDDFVMLQPHKKGPDTYGRESYVNYRKSQNEIVSITVEPEKVFTCGSEWGIEFGKEYLEMSNSGIQYPMLIKYVKVLNREDGNWKYARTVNAIDQWSEQAPPAPGKITNNGYGTWYPREQTEQTAAEVKKIMKLLVATKLMSDTEATNFNKVDILALPDEKTGPLLAYFPDGELHSMEEYMAIQRAGKTFQIDDLRKIVEEIVVCDDDLAFVFGQDVYSGSSLITGERELNSSDFWYQFTRQNNEWKLGPNAVVIAEM